MYSYSSEYAIEMEYDDECITNHCIRPVIGMDIPNSKSKT
jgi:hypothetical protein